MKPPISVAAALALALAGCEATTSAVEAMAGHAGSVDRRVVRGDGRLDLPDYRDCDHNAIDGRETDVRSSREHCGACDHPCAYICEAGACVKKDGAEAGDAGLDDAGRA